MDPNKHVSWYSQCLYKDIYVYVCSFQTQYEFLYDLAIAYINSCEEYANFKWNVLCFVSILAWAKPKSVALCTSGDPLLFVIYNFSYVVI